jgi:D-lactate dehydrogenase
MAGGDQPVKVAIELLAQSEIISLHCPLTPKNKYIVSDAAIARMKKGVMLVNTSRGALLDTVAIIDGLKSDKIGYRPRRLRGGRRNLF